MTKEQSSPRISPPRRSSDAHEPWRDQVPSTAQVFFATCMRGLGEFLAMELDPKYNLAGRKELGTKVLQVVNSGVYFTGDDLSAGYYAVVFSRVAIRVLAEIAVIELDPRSSKAYQDQVYDATRLIPWESYLGKGMTFSVDARVSHGNYNQNSVRVRVKDAICDTLVDMGMPRPIPPGEDSVANVPIFVTFSNGTELRIYRDLAGMSLHKRGYRTKIHKSSLNETVAAAMLYMAGSTPDRLLASTTEQHAEGALIVDPCVGSGTLLLEAALLDMQVAPGLFRREFVFESWPDFDSEVFESVLDDAFERVHDKPKYKYLGSDIHGGALSLAKDGVRMAGLAKYECFELVQSDVADLVVNPDKENVALVLVNPPWGMRLDEDEQTWRSLGEFLKQSCPGSQALIISGNADSTRALRLKATCKHPVRTGDIDCRVLVYNILKKREDVAVDRNLEEAWKEDTSDIRILDQSGRQTMY